jgi:5-methylcytosine-specific restriction endonuclease McrA
MPPEDAKQKKREYDRRRYAANPGPARERSRRRYEENPEKIAEYQRRYVTDNIEKVQEYQRRYREAHRKEGRERSQQWRGSAVNCAKAAEYQRRHREENPEKTAAALRHWHDMNPNKGNEYAAKRRALKSNAPQGDPSETAAYEQILREGICEICGAKGPIEVDHIEPLSKGGEHGWENMAGLCGPCNRSKGNKSLLIFLLDRLGPSAK